MIEIVYKYLFGKIHCKIFGHKQDKSMEEYGKFCCDRCHLIEDLQEIKQ